MSGEKIIQGLREAVAHARKTPSASVELIEDAGPLPPDGSTSRYIGFCAKGRPHVLQWADGANAWMAVGFCERAVSKYAPWPEVFLLKESDADHIKWWLEVVA